MRFFHFSLLFRTPLDLAKRLELCSQVVSHSYQRTTIYSQKARPCSTAAIIPLVTTPQRNVSPSPAAPHLAAQGGPSQSGFHEQFFALFCSFSPHFALPGQPGTHCPRPGGTPHSYSLRDLFCCLLFYRGEQNSAEEAGLLSMKPIPERTSTALLAG